VCEGAAGVPRATRSGDAWSRRLSTGLVLAAVTDEPFPAGDPGNIDITEVVADELELRQAFREFNRDVLSTYPPDTDWDAVMGGLVASWVAAGQIDVPEPERLIERYPEVIMPDGSRIKIRGKTWIVARGMTVEEIDAMIEEQVREMFPSLHGTADGADQTEAIGRG
jgi:hypothetical protein